MPKRTSGEMDFGRLRSRVIETIDEDGAFNSDGSDAAAGCRQIGTPCCRSAQA